MANLGEVGPHPRLHDPLGFCHYRLGHRPFSQCRRSSPRSIDACRSLTRTISTSLHQTCEEFKKIVRESPLPPDLEELLHVHYGRLEKLTHSGVKVALRSSALGEDSAGVSFAGLYRTVLHVDKENLVSAYKEIIASKYGTKAIAYRRKRGYRHEDIEMCVGCLAMVDALVSGVTYSKDPPGKKRARSSASMPYRGWQQALLTEHELPISIWSAGTSPMPWSTVKCARGEMALVQPMAPVPPPPSPTARSKNWRKRRCPLKIILAAPGYRMVF